MPRKPICSHSKATRPNPLRQNKGQIIVEYILLVVVVVIAAVLLSKLLVGRSDGDAGIIITKWSQLLQMIGADVGD